jgi:hypothetical protein
MLDAFTPYVGAAAAFLASLSYVPQVRKAWPRGATSDFVAHDARGAYGRALAVACLRSAARRLDHHLRQRDGRFAIGDRARLQIARLASRSSIASLVASKRPDTPACRSSN